MYILLPDSFYVSSKKNKLGSTEMVLSSSRTMKKGERFLQYSGDWNVLIGEEKDLIRRQLNLMIQEKTVNWFKLLKICNDRVPANACIRKLENQMLLEMLIDMPANTQIIAADYSQVFQGQSNSDSELEKNKFVLVIDENAHPDFKSNYTVSAEAPLDLTWKKPSARSEIAGNIQTIEKRTMKSSSKVQKLLQCEVCNKYFDRPSLLKRHTRTHTGEKPHICDVCQKGFSTSSSLNTHRRIHSGERPHQCSICAKRFTASSNLYYHKMTHSKEKPHKCQICEKSFPTPGNLKAHQYSHSGHWPFTCKVCGRGFGKQTNFRNHQALHSNRNL